MSLLQIPKMKLPQYIHDVQNMSDYIKKVGNYQILGSFEKGSFGTVHFAKNVLTNERLCVKIFDKAKYDTKEKLDSLLDEVLILSELDHPNIVKFHDFLEDEHNYYLFQELCRGKTLFQLIQDSKQFPIKNAKEIFKQILFAVDYMHENNIAHRDLKPENIIIDNDNHVKIIDFGLSTKNANKLNEKFCGSPQYVAPEILRYVPYIPEKSDIWSCGVILYTMLVGRFPWKSPIFQEFRREILLCQITTPNGMPVVIERLLKDMIKKNPKERPTAKELLSHKWFANENESEITEKQTKMLKRIPIRQTSKSLSFKEVPITHPSTKQ